MRPGSARLHRGMRRPIRRARRRSSNGSAAIRPTIPAALAVVQPWAASDPAAAARLLASVGARGTGGVGPEFAIARNWAQRDPPQPPPRGRWTYRPMSRGLALPIVAGAWALQDPGRCSASGRCARRPAKRADAVLTAAVRSQGAAPPDLALLGAFSDDRARQAALMGTIVATAQTDPAAARRLLDAHITDRLHARAGLSK